MACTLLFGAPSLVTVLITGSHSQTLLPFQTSGARQTQTTLVLSTRISLFLICPIAPHSIHTLLFIFLWDLNILESKGNAFNFIRTRLINMSNMKNV